MKLTDFIEKSKNIYNIVPKDENKSLGFNMNYIFFYVINKRIKN